MAKIEIIDWEGVKTGEQDLPDEIFKVKPKGCVVHDALLRAQTIYSAPFAHVKGRSEVRGGGIKPWRQKGTGRARASSIRSPLWIGGGITHGPNKNRSFTNRLNKKQVKLAVRMLLSDLLNQGKLKITANIPLVKKTREFQKILGKVILGKTLLVINEEEKFLAARNIPGISFATPENLGVPTLMRADLVLLEKGTAEKIVDRL